MDKTSEPVPLSNNYRNPQSAFSDTATLYGDHTIDVPRVSSDSNGSYNTFQNHETIENPERFALYGILPSIPSDETLTKHNSGFLSALWNFIKSFIGLGVISIAGVMEHSGIVLGSIWMMFSGFLSLYGTNIIIKARRQFLRNHYKEVIKDNFLSDNNSLIRNQRLSHEVRLDERQPLEADVDSNARTYYAKPASDKDTLSLLFGNSFIKQYADLGMASYGLTGFRVTILTLVIQQMMVVIAYLYFLDHYFESWAWVPVLIPVWMFFDIKTISHLSLISVLLISVSWVTILGISISDIHERNQRDDFKYLEFFEFPLFYGVSIFMFEGDVIALNIEDSMK
jgi:hypothetical protein